MKNIWNKSSIQAVFSKGKTAVMIAIQYLGRLSLNWTIKE